jgi:DNA modification methylase
MPSRWELIDLIIWRYDISYDPARKKYKPVYEWVLRMGYGDIPRPKRHMTDWYLPIVKGNSIERRDLIHPAMFPLGLVEAALRESDATRPGSLVVDPFLGSGTTIAACINHGVPSVGFELSLDYKADIAHRMKQFEDIDKADPVEDPAKTAREPDTKGLSLFGWKDDKPKAP